MKGAKGGKRDRIISFLFSKKNADLKKELISNEQSKNINGNYRKEYNLNETLNDRQKETHVGNIERQQITKDEMLTKNDDVELTKEKELDIEKHQTDQLKDIITKEPIINRETQVKQDEKKGTIEITDTPVIDEEQIKLKPPEDEKKTVSPIPVEENNNIEEIEKIVLDAIEKMVKEDLNELEEIQYEIEILNQKENDEYLTEEVEKLKDRLNELIDKFNKIRDKYYSTGTIKIDALDIEDKYIYDLIQEYKDDLKETTITNEIQNEVEQIQNYISIMNQILDVEISKDEIDEKIDEKLDKFEIRDDEFEKMKDEYQNIEQIKNEIDKFNDEQYKIIKDIEQKIATTGTYTRTIETDTHLVTHLNRLIEAAMLVSLSKKIPPTPRGNIIKIAMITSAVRNASRFITTEQQKKEIIKVDFDDFSNDILDSIKNIGDVSYKIDDAFNNIDKIRQNFKEQCEQYAGQIKEFDELIKNLDNVEKELKSKKDLVLKYQDDLNKVLDKNNQKVKRFMEDDGKETPIAS